MIKSIGALFLVVIVSSVLGCTKFKSYSDSELYSQSLFSSGDSDLNPESDKISEGCRTESRFDACIVYKNPVAQGQRPVSLSELDSVLRFGVKIHGMSTSGQLENSGFQILTLNTPRFALANRSNFKDQFSDSRSLVEQVTAYYWANRVVEYVGARVGKELVPLSGLKIYVDDSFTGFSSLKNSISLEKSGSQIPKALNADVLIQLMGQSIAYQLSDKKVFDLKNLVQHKFCNLNPKGCCATNVGCANALASGFGDYLVGVMFPKQPKLGETLSQSNDGQDLCSLRRDLEQLSGQTRAAVFAACKVTGSVPLEGAWYASLWWKVRTQARLNSDAEARDIDTLFFKHAKSWTAATTFADAKSQALVLATQFKLGKYVGVITSGLAPIDAN